MTGKTEQSPADKTPQGSDPTSVSYPIGRPVAQGGLLPQVRPEAGGEPGQEGVSEGLSRWPGPAPRAFPQPGCCKLCSSENCVLPFVLFWPANHGLWPPSVPARPSPAGPLGPFWGLSLLPQTSSASSEPGGKARPGGRLTPSGGRPWPVPQMGLSFKKHFMVLRKGNTRQGSKSREGLGGRRGPSLGILAPGLARWRNLDQVLPLWASLFLPGIAHGVSWCVWDNGGAGVDPSLPWGPGVMAHV